jgi:hypothetical protein
MTKNDYEIEKEVSAGKTSVNGNNMRFGKYKMGQNSKGGYYKNPEIDDDSVTEENKRVSNWNHSRRLK